MGKSIIEDKSKAFALNIIKICSYLVNEQKEYVMSKQLLRSGTSIGANVKEAEKAQSKADFYSKTSIALKEANETEYWLELLIESGILPEHAFPGIWDECEELIRILVAITKSCKQNINQ